MSERNELTDRELDRLKSGREYRAMTMTARAAGDESEERIVDGYATTFNQPYVLYDFGDYTVREQIAPGAFDECDMSDVIFQYDHRGRVFARNRNGTLTLATDNIGLKITANLGGTEIGRQLYEEVKGGYTDRMSFGFIVAEDERVYTTDHETGHEDCLRTITKISKLFDVSAVSLPANDMTSISARRAADGVIDELRTERSRREHKRTAIRLKLLEV